MTKKPAPPAAMVISPNRLIQNVYPSWCRSISISTSPMKERTMTNKPSNADVRILVIEDNEQTRKLYKVLLENEGYKVCAVEDGQRGWSFAQSIAPHLILLDLNLPNMGGLEV